MEEDYDVYGSVKIEQRRLEVLLDALVYNPRNRRKLLKDYRSGKLLRLFKGLRGITGRLFGSIRKNGIRLYFTGVSHLDAAWLWPVYDTKIRAYKTFYNAVEHCKRYPFFIFAETSPQYYLWIKKYAPDLYSRVKKLVAEGRIEITGGMWVEPSLDMPCGEALVRHRLYGQLFYLREFGFYPKLASLLDVFGYPYTLPQILVKTGAEYFWITKNMWNDENKWPFCNFYWRGADGSEIFVYQFIFNWDALMHIRRFVEMARYPAPEYYGKVINSRTPPEEIEEMFDKSGRINPNLAVFYGIGDGGRGPLEPEIICADTLAQLHGGKHIRQHDFFRMQKKIVGRKCFIWDDELYLEFHRGVKTTQLAVKHYNRRAEHAAITAENLQTVMATVFGSAPVSKVLLFEMWRKILFNQFHDILPGSSIPDVYFLAVKELRESISAAKEIIAGYLEEFAGSEIKESPAERKSNPKSFVIFNPFGFEREEYGVFGDRLYKFRIKPLSLAIVAAEETAVRDPSEGISVGREDDYLYLDNGRLTLKLDVKTGEPVFLVDKETGEDLFNGDSGHILRGGFRVFRDNPTRYPAWNLDRLYPLKKIRIKPTGPPIITEDSVGRPCIKTEYRFGKSLLRAVYYMNPDEKAVRISLHTDLKDPEVLVKYFIPVAVKSETVRAEIPYGSIERRRIKKTSWEKAKWEMPMQKWVDVSDEQRGIAVFNNNRYGFGATARYIHISIARTPKYSGVSILYGANRMIPKEKWYRYHDMYPFDFELGIYPHKGDWKDADVPSAAYAFDHPLTETILPLYTDVESKLFGPFLEVGTPGIHVGTLKLPEGCGESGDELREEKDWVWNGKQFVVRLAEQFGRNARTVIKFTDKIKVEKVVETDMLERDVYREYPVVDNSIELEFGPFEIKTLSVIFDKKNGDIGMSG